MKATSEILKEIQEGKRALRNTRCKDCNGNTIMELDYIHVENKEYNYEGIVEFDGKQWCAVYYDIGEREELALSLFPIENRQLLVLEKGDPTALLFSMYNCWNWLSYDYEFDSDEERLYQEGLDQTEELRIPGVEYNDI